MKFIKLCENELIKIIKKTSTKVMIILTILSVIGALGFTYLIKFLNKVSEEAIYDYSINVDEQITELNNELKQGTTFSEQSKGYIQAELDMYQLAKENDINLNIYYDYWKINLLYDIQSKKCELVDLKLKDADKKDIEKAQNYINKQIEVLKENNYEGYINLEKENLKTNLDNKKISKKDYDLQIELLDLTKKYEIGKNGNSEESWKSDLVYEIKTLKKNIATGIDSNTGKVLTVEKQKEQQDAITVDLYRLENNMPMLESMSDYRAIYDNMAISFTSMFLAIMMIMIAGSSISTEISKGTIKFWTITPYKRWKILLSKILVAVMILVVMTLIISLLSDLIGGIFFRDNEAQDYLYVKDGKVKSINHNVYTILYNSVSNVAILMFILFAIMLSTITRNTAVSVGVSIATYIGGSTIMAIINNFVKYDFVKFIPFNNLNFVNKVFPNSVSYMTMETASSMLNQVSVGFSVSVLIVCAILMLTTMFDSFNKRDII